VIDAASDRPDVVVFPPLIWVATMALAALLQWLMPTGFLSRVDLGFRVLIGAAVLVAGVSLAATGRRTLVRLGTNVSPLSPTTALATEGIFGWTRNPLYVGGTLAMLGFALIGALDWLPVLLVPSLLILHRGVVLREESYLERKFGDAYRRYKANVPRYGFRV
jgi:protein-S-isoprenylcysteine O-methyltransferase Ste14